MGKINCELFEKEAPMTVANFVGLARGRKAFVNPKTGAPDKKPFFDGLTFHRVIPGFMIQGGDPLGVGSGEPGYRFGAEPTPTFKHDRPGTLSMANAGPGTNGCQFFITEVPTPHLDPGYNIFGRCKEVDIVRAIARVAKDAMDPSGSRPKTDVVMKKVTIHR
jgi:peptidyl-prolyl cis-trans isomerase A (cyclophilin A)